MIEKQIRSHLYLFLIIIFVCLIFACLGAIISRKEYYSQEVILKEWYMVKTIYAFEDYIYCTDRIIKTSEGLTTCYTTRGFVVQATFLTLGEGAFPPRLYSYGVDITSNCALYYPETGCTSTRDSIRYILTLEDGTQCDTYRSLWEKVQVGKKLFYKVYNGKVQCRTLREHGI